MASAPTHGHELHSQLMVDLFGNYLCQTLISSANEGQRHSLLVKVRHSLCLSLLWSSFLLVYLSCTSIVHLLITFPPQVKPHITQIACDRQGTRAVQKMMLECKTTRERDLLLSALCGDFAKDPPPADASGSNGLGWKVTNKAGLMQLIRNANGSHVVRALLDHFPPEMSRLVRFAASQSTRTAPQHWKHITQAGKHNIALTNVPVSGGPLRLRPAPAARHRPAWPLCSEEEHQHGERAGPPAFRAQSVGELVGVCQ
jgi:hypothetical protein